MTVGSIDICCALAAGLIGSTIVYILCSAPICDLPKLEEDVYKLIRQFCYNLSVLISLHGPSPIEQTSN